MLYEAYEAKMQRIAAVVDKIRKYRVLIIICLALILLAIGAFLFFKGTLLSDAVAPSEPILYGQSVDFSGKALFGKTGSQYRTADGEWQDGFPILPGEYTVRAVSKRSFGFKQYGAEQSVTLIARPLTVAIESSAVYGDAPEFSCNGLISGDAISDISVEYADPYASVTEAVIERITVLNGDGTDVTLGYVLTFENNVVTFQKRPVTLKTDSAEKIYDGLPLLAEGVTVTVGSTAYGDTFSYSSYASLTDAVEGGIENRPAGLKIVNSEGTDVTHMYSVTEELGRLTVLKREIAVQSSSHEKVYDESPIVGLNASISDGALVDGHSVEFKFTNEKRVGAGSCENLFEVKVSDGSGRDVSGNYKVNKTYGTLNIKKRPATVTGSSMTWIFDGLVHSASTLSPRFTASNQTDVSGILTTHRVECKTEATIHTVGEAENLPTEIRIFNAHGTDVTENYDITSVGGTLTVIKRAITVTVKSSEFVYTGGDRTYGGEFDGKIEGIYYTVTAGEQVKLPDGSVIDTALSEEDIILAASSVDNIFVSCTYEGSICRVGTAEVTATVNVYQQVIDLIYSKNLSVTDCYDITVISGTITVLPRKIALTPENVTGTYNGKTVAVTELQTTASYTDTVYQDPMEITVVPTVWVTAEGTVVGDYISHIVRWQIMTSEGEDVSDCFQVTENDGIYTVQPRPIKIVFSNGSWVYDGLTHRIEGEDAYTVVSRIGSETVALCEGHTVLLNRRGEITDVGTEIHGLEGDIVIRDASGNEVTSNYDITVTDGTLTVTPRPITVTVGSAEKVYDGATLTEEGYEVTSGSLVDRHVITAKTSGELLNVGTTDNSAEVTVKDGETDVTANYDITVVKGTLTVTPRPLVIKTGSAEKMYDGTALTEDSFELVSGDVVEGQKLFVRVTGSQIGAGVGQNLATVTVKAGDEELTYNYDITLLVGDLTVTKRPVKFVAEAYGFTYDSYEREGKEVCVLRLDESEGYYPLANGHGVADFSIVFSSDKVQSASKVKLAGNYTVTVKNVVIKDKDGTRTDVSENYEMELVGTSLTVMLRAITVTAASGEFEYDGNTHYVKELTPEYEITFDEDPTLNGVADNDKVQRLSVKGEITLPGTAPSTVESFKIYSDKDEDVTFCYSITLKDGVLTMNKSNVTVISNDAQKVYDGTPLTEHGFITEGVLYPGDSIVAEFTGSQTEIGSSLNTFTYIIVNPEGEDVTESYNASLECGLLRVTKKDESTGGGTGDISGNISNAKPDENSKKTVFTFVATSNGRIYFREGHFGDYDPLYGWYSAPDGEDKYSYAMIAEAIIGVKNKDSVTVNPVSSMLYFGTYYADKRTVGEGRTSTQYSMDYYRYDYLHEDIAISYTGDLKAYEEACREFAYANYTDVPEKTRTAMLEIIADAAASTGADLSSMTKKELIAWVSNYIQGAVPYDLHFPDFPAGVDKAIYFLTEAESGVCRHFATSAAVMYRVLGIPARYTVGYVSSASAGKTVNVTGMEAHAWVEVYVDGVGWVIIDPTGGGSGGSGNPDDGGSEPPVDDGKIGRIVLVPYEIKKVYTGEAFYCQNDQFWIKSGKELLPDGYRISVTIEGSQTAVGRGESVITKVSIYDADGNNITKQYDLRAEKGVIEVMPIKIVVYTASATKEYDGRRLSAEECNVSMGKLLSGHTLKASGFNYIVNVGSEANTVDSVRIYDSDGNDVTDCYEIDIHEGTLTVTSGG